MATFTCLSCHVAFKDGDGQRDHFRSDWHRYNLMRKVAELSPVSREAFNERVGQARSQAATAAGDATKIPCRPCKKTFSSQQAYDNHIQSKKHVNVISSYAEVANNRKNKLKNQETKPQDIDDEVEEEEDIEVEEVDSDEWEGEAIEVLDCLFCKHHSDTVENELHHMTEKHSFFIPDLEYCIDVEGLIRYLGEKIGCGYECLACKWTARRCPSLDSIRKHIMDKRHCEIVLEGDTLLEYAEFYDYSSSYPDAGAGALPDDEVQQTVLTGGNYELVLPSGATVGHRSLCRYYRQKLDPNRKVVVHKNKPGHRFREVMAQYRALNWNGATRADVERKVKDLNFLTRMQSKHHMKLSVKANKLFVMRDQNPV